MLPALPVLAGRHALVTGSSRGIGRGIALELAAAGAAFTVHYRRDERAAQEVAGTIIRDGGRAALAQAALDVHDGADRVAEAALSSFGSADILVLNAGIASRGLPVADTDPAELVQVMLGIDDMALLDEDQPLGRLVRPEDVGRLVRFLVSGEAAMVTGRRIVVDGGADASPTGLR